MLRDRCVLNEGDAGTQRPWGRGHYAHHVSLVGDYKTPGIVLTTVRIGLPVVVIDSCKTSAGLLIPFKNQSPMLYHARTVLSPDPEYRRSPLGDQATLYT